MVLTAAAGAIGAVATVAVLGIVGVFERDPPRVSVQPRPTASTDAARVATRVSPGIASVIANTAGGGEHRGSGIAVGAHQILTTTSVVDASTGPASHIEICLANGRWHVATETGRDAVTGLVLLDVPTLSVQPTEIAHTVAVQPGEWVAAVGRSASNSPWVTTGVITATGGFATDPNGVARAGMITTSAELGPDVRGGALVDQHGRVVGILVGANPFDATSAAIPADMAHDVTMQLASNGTASHGALGLMAADTHERGVTITDVTPGASAATAGIRVGDRILAVDGVPTPNTARLVAELHRRAAGQRVRITVGRGTRKVSVTARLDDAGNQLATRPGATPPTSIEPVAATGSR